MNANRILAFCLLLFPMTLPAQTIGFYAGFGLGYVDLGRDVTGIGAAAGAAGVAGTVTGLDDSGLSWKLFGGYQFDDFFSAELAYADLGDSEATFVATAPTAATINIGTQAGVVSASVVSIYPLNSDLDIFGRLGATYWDVNGIAVAAVGGATVGANADDAGVGYLFGLGVQYNFTQEIGLRLEWENYHGVGNEDSGTGGSANLFGGSLLYQF